MKTFITILSIATAFIFTSCSGPAEQQPVRYKFYNKVTGKEIKYASTLLNAMQKNQAIRVDTKTCDTVSYAK